MKKLLTIFLSLFLVFSLTSCEDIIDSLLEDEETDEPATTDDPADDVPDDTADGDGDDDGDNSLETDLQTSTLRSNIIALAREQIGVDYAYGEETPENGFDCSGLCYYCYGEYGITLPRTSSAQYAGGTKVGMEGAKVGDIVAFGDPVSHVGMIITSTTFIHAPHTGSTVTEESLEGYWSEEITGVASYIND